MSENEKGPEFDGAADVIALAAGLAVSVVAQRDKLKPKARPGKGKGEREKGVGDHR